MPNTAPPLTDREAIRRRIQLADEAASPVFHGIYAGLTSDARQTEEMLRVHEDLFPRVVGFKLYAGSTTGDLAVADEAEQKRLFQTLAAAGYRGVLAVHCEKESLLRKKGWNRREHGFRGSWNPRRPLLHCRSRPPKAEIESVRDILRMAGDADFRGTLHICHVSTPAAVRRIAAARRGSERRITCGVTPHHLLLSESRMSGPNGYLLRMNPPLRKERLRSTLLDLLLEGSIDWIESDHAPHLAKEKWEGVSGIPVLPVYPFLLRYLQNQGLSAERIKRLVQDNIAAAFELPADVWVQGKSPEPASGDLAGEYDFDPFAAWKKRNPL
jgi:dihydroorotase